jgi:hypothetical protein
MEQNDNNDRNNSVGLEIYKRGKQVSLVLLETPRYLQGFYLGRLIINLCHILNCRPLQLKLQQRDRENSAVRSLII